MAIGTGRALQYNTNMRDKINSSIQNNMTTIANAQKNARDKYNTWQKNIFNSANAGTYFGKKYAPMEGDDEKGYALDGAPFGLSGTVFVQKNNGQWTASDSLGNTRSFIDKFDYWNKDGNGVTYSNGNIVRDLAVRGKTKNQISSRSDLNREGWDELNRLKNEDRLKYQGISLPQTIANFEYPYKDANGNNFRTKAEWEAYLNYNK